MSGKTKNVVIRIEDMPKSEQELTPEMAKVVIGGVVSRVPTAYGTHDYITRTSHWDSDVREIEEPGPRPRPKPILA